MTDKKPGPFDLAISYLGRRHRRGPKDETARSCLESMFALRAYEKYKPLIEAGAKVDKMLELCGRAMRRVSDNKTYDILSDLYDHLLASLPDEPKGEHT